MKSAGQWFREMPTNNLHVWIEAIQKDAQDELHAELEAAKTKVAHAKASYEAEFERVNGLQADCFKALEKLEAAKRENAQLAAALQQCLDSIPGHHEGQLVNVHYDGDGNELGIEPVDPIGVVQSIQGYLLDARAGNGTALRDLLLPIYNMIPDRESVPQWRSDDWADCAKWVKQSLRDLCGKGTNAKV